MYKLIALDLDGTILSNNEISEGNKKTLAEIRASGIYVVLCSGRSYASMERFVNELDLKAAGEYAVCYNGGRVYTTIDNEPIYEKLLPIKTALEIFDYHKKSGLGGDLMCYLGDKLIVEEITEAIEIYVGFSKIPVHVMPFESITGDLSKVLLCGKKDELVEAKNNLVPFLDRTAMHFSSDRLFEIVDKEVSKGAGLNFLANYLGIAQEEVIAVGDNHNDLSMIEFAGLGVAVANAEPELKSAAKHVLNSACDQDAVKELADKFIWNQK